MHDCCHPDYQHTFDAKKAREELGNYLRDGVMKSTRPLLDALNELPLAGTSLLDIGGGVGVLFFELQPKGMREVTYVDLSAAYREAFLGEAARRGLSGLVQTHQGDFLDLHARVAPADLVTLDKVICCYENYRDLVAASAGKARRWYAYTLPRDVWWVRWINQLGMWMDKLRGKAFRTYVHPTGAIEHMVLGLGFRKRAERRQREWLTVVCERVD